ncbi:MAG: InlB B-repeat-containing protein [Candidatus Absconditabacteria bacterium]|nr:InlB B-repeat-containing protein [Candidatus Absconditabacteria bacterium]MDD3868203.1 InlB B-repeat-containing protein [Candidatus Absconditabacteria bacterium]MDD4714590.1 InlB B-repeat-containing protein [Candidatus Absconditabacteria bacterium]
MQQKQNCCRKSSISSKKIINKNARSSFFMTLGILGMSLLFGGTGIFLLSESSREVMAQGGSNTTSVIQGIDNVVQKVQSLHFVNSGVQIDLRADLSHTGGKLEVSNAVVAGGNASLETTNFIGGVSNAITQGVSSLVGGQQNTINAKAATLLGGGENQNLSNYGFIGGGKKNTLSTSSQKGVVLGGEKNESTSSVILGQKENIINGKAMIVAGKNIRSTASVENSFVWSDADSLFNPQSSSTFYINSARGVGVNTASPQASLDSKGSVKFGEIPNNCTPANVGVIGYKNGYLCSCTNGRYWNTLNADPTGVGVEVCNRDNELCKYTSVTNSRSEGCNTTVVNRTVTFNGNGGSGHSPTTKTVQNGQAVGTLPTSPTRAGYTFNGWYTAASGGTQVTTSTVVTSNVTYYAQWTTTVVNRTVTFDGNGGSGHSPTTKTVQNGQAVGTLPTSPTRAGYTFNGWYTAASGGTQITTSTVVTSNVTYYAQWTTTVVNRTVTFDGNGGSGHSPTTKTVQNGQAVGTLPTSPTRAGYIFNGWYTAASGGTQITTSTVVTSNVTYYAQWTTTVVNRTVTFNGNGGSGHSPTTKTVQNGQAVGTLPTSPTRAGYTFNGRYTAASGGTQVTTSTVVTSNVTYYAQWTTTVVNRTLTFDGNGGSGHSPTTKTVQNGQAVGTLPSAPTRAGYTFNGRYTAVSGGTQVTASTVVSANVTYYAQWTILNRTVTFNGNGGSGHSPTTKTVQDGQAVGTLPTSPTRAGYTFNGWYTAASGGTQITTSTVVNANVTYYAQWIVNGVCGSANGTAVSAAPTSNLCSAGTASAVAGSGPWTWTCNGSNGGTNDNCSANKIAPITIKGMASGNGRNSVFILTSSPYPSGSNTVNGTYSLKLKMSDGTSINLAGSMANGAGSYWSSAAAYTNTTYDIRYKRISGVEVSIALPNITNMNMYSIGSSPSIHINGTTYPLTASISSSTKTISAYNNNINTDIYDDFVLNGGIFLNY